ncbi:MAG: GNAT family N-acetyltransferase [Rhizobiaceae bacterium]
MENIEIRESLPEDLPSIETLYSDAFPDEDLLPLVKELLQERTDVLSLVAIKDNAPVGHIIMTYCSVPGYQDKLALLGPLAVSTNCQRQGIGSAITHRALGILGSFHVTNVYVLGDPAYYGRLGFSPQETVEPPYPLPKEWAGAWQVISLNETSSSPKGKLSVPLPWRKPELWAP